MGRTLTLTANADSFTQGLDSDNVAITLNTLGGNDQVSINRSDDLGGDNRVNTGTGKDTVVSFKEFGNVISLGTGNDTYVGRGFGNFSTDLIDQVFAGAGNDLIAVETFHSKYFGGTGNDKFFSVGWQNTFHGGRGTDTISYAARDENSTLGGTGVTVDLAAGVTQTGTLRREFLISIENATGSGADDLLFGTNGANRLEGAGGIDQMTGRGGADRFVFAKITDAAVVSDGLDLVTDFTRSQGDKVSLNLIDANTGASGNQAFRFIGTNAFSGRAGELQIEVLTDGILVSGDVNGDGTADFQLGLLGLTSAIAGDFML